MSNPVSPSTNANPQQQVVLNETGGPLRSGKDTPLVSHGTACVHHMSMSVPPLLKHHR
jgi:hypothetical protein